MNIFERTLAILQEDTTDKLQNDAKNILKKLFNHTTDNIRVLNAFKSALSLINRQFPTNNANTIDSVYRNLNLNSFRESIEIDESTPLTLLNMISELKPNIDKQIKFIQIIKMNRYYRDDIDTIDFKILIPSISYDFKKMKS